MQLGAAIMSGPRTTNAAHAMPRIARLRSTIPRVRRDGADRESLWLIPPSKPEGRCGGVCDFSYVRDTRHARRTVSPWWWHRPAVGGQGVAGDVELPAGQHVVVEPAREKPDHRDHGDDRDAQQP